MVRFHRRWKEMVGEQRLCVGEDLRRAWRLVTLYV